MWLIGFILVSYILTCLGLSKLFPQAGVEASKAWIPGVNFMEWCKLIGRKPSYALWLLFPIVNIFIWCGMAVDLVRSFGKNEFKDAAGAVIWAPASFWVTANDENAKYEGPILDKERQYLEAVEAAKKSNNKYELEKLAANNPFKKPAWREWVESLVFAVFAAAFIRMFLIEAYVIPTPSMEGSLNVGDYLFVSKAHYGTRLPMTVAMVPLLHNRVPFINTESYLEKPSLPYKRLPALEEIEVGKPIVFNWPVGDSIYLTPTRSFYARQPELDPDYLSDRNLYKEYQAKNIITRPVDKRDHYIKRCMGAPGDSLQIIDKQVHINGQPVKNPEHLQFLYYITLPQGFNLNMKRLDEWGIDDGDFAGKDRAGNIYYHLDQSQVDKLKSLDKSIKVTPYPQEVSPLKLFPNDPKNFPNWSVDNYGPIWIPKKGVTVQLTNKNISLYQRIINVYENNDFKVENGKFIINGQATSEYTFKQDYYWGMGDNRHNSEDSRMWGFIPHDHMVGKPLFIFFSTKEGSLSRGINWDRVMTSATKY